MATVSEKRIEKLMPRHDKGLSGDGDNDKVLKENVWNIISWWYHRIFMEHKALLISQLTMGICSV